VITSVKTIGVDLNLTTDLGHTKVHTVVQDWFARGKNIDTELAAHQHRVEQLSPQPKVEFERDPEDYDD
jgi:hypothetical protein